MSNFIKLSSELLVDVDSIILISANGDRGINIVIDGKYKTNSVPYYWCSEPVQWDDIVNIPELNRDTFIHTTAFELWDLNRSYDTMINKKYIKIAKAYDDDKTKSRLIWTHGEELVDIPIDDVAKILMEEG